MSAPMAEAKVCTYNTCSSAINSWQGVQICDGDADGNAVESNYYRDSGGHGAVQEYSGSGNCESSGSSSDHVYRHQAHQMRDFAPDSWSSWEYRY
ncbi:hypothetical protein R6L23_03510 [Streptomyces sp. SR27]|uniref:hypothetical protein n=1 Tax=Streptomyces sp. SR27 TaxID=3076630 RepID=UPI00295B117C|nr:hypothetical protein [Streptomyces sp. SR27]MDV9187293.1 hypothetical protein [Streptomyces sp. SR27]